VAQALTFARAAPVFQRPCGSPKADSAVFPPPRLSGLIASVDEPGAITLQEITAGTVRSVCALDVAPEQRGYVASNAISLAEANFNPGAWFRAICLNDAPVGFVMMRDPSIPGAKAKGLAADEIGLWRLMIDRNHQRRGHGRRALDLVRDLSWRRQFRRMVSSYVPGVDGPGAFYLNYGFTRTGNLRNDGREVEIALDL
jgi:diamine N-acetyltransferase